MSIKASLPMQLKPCAVRGIGVNSGKMLAARKQVLREEIRTRLRSVTCANRGKWSDEGTSRLLELPEIQTADEIYLFASLPSEIDTNKIFEALRSSGKRVAMPRMQPDACELEAVYVSSLARLKMNQFGIREPVDACEGMARPSDLDVFVVPGVAFDRSGSRLGRGKGYYDRFLAGHRRGQPCIGLFYALQEVDEVPIHDQDQKMDIIVTHQEVIRCALPVQK